METSVFPALLPLAAFTIGFIIAWFFVNRTARQAMASLSAQLGNVMNALSETQISLASEQGKNAQLIADRTAARDQFVSEREALSESIRVGVVAAASQAFDRERAATLSGVEKALNPVTVNLERLKSNLDELEQKREVNAESVRVSIDGLTNVGKAMSDAVAETKKENAVLIGALRDNRVRGKWGEIALESALERAGLAEHVHFETQASQGEGIPDVTVHLPGGRHVPIDAKAPLAAYLAAFDTSDAVEQKRFFRENAKSLRVKIKDVAERGYHLARGSCGYTVLYIPIESVLSAALSVDPELAEFALEKNILLASPLTLMIQLRAFAAAWALDKEQQHSEQIVAHALELAKRLLKVGQYLDGTGRALNKVVKEWNAAIGSFDGNLTRQAMLIYELAGQPAEISERHAIETIARSPQRLDALPSNHYEAMPTFPAEVALPEVASTVSEPLMEHASSAGATALQRSPFKDVVASFVGRVKARMMSLLSLLS